MPISSARTLLLGVLLAAPGLMPARLQAAEEPRPITLSVDAAEAPRKILHARLVIPVSPGDLTLVYPKWIPGEHGPTGPISDLIGLKLTAEGKTIPWRRDLVDMYTFHCEVPAGVTSIEVALDFPLPTATEGFSSGASASDRMMVLSWNTVLLYPLGRPAAELTYAARLKLPRGWKFGTALPVARSGDDGIEFKPVPLTTLIDSPVIAGVHFRVVPLTPGKTPSHEIDIAADSDAALDFPADLPATYTRLVDEALALFGGRHYQEYHFLFSLSDHVAHFGLEHHESSDNRVPERTLVEDALRRRRAGLLSHEFVHSWNGKYRRPAGLTTDDYQKPMKGDLLWVYEGLTDYLGTVLAARSGLLSQEDTRTDLARVAAYLDQRPGRTWRPLADTADAAQILFGTPDAWKSWRRSVDFYDEGTLIWLEADVTIRTRSHGKRSLEDFCRRFAGPPSGPPAVRTYTFDDVVRTMNEVEPYDWKTYFTTRLESTAPRAPLGGIEGAGWRLAFGETLPDYLKALEEADKVTNLSHSIGVIVKEGGVLQDVIPGLPAAVAGAGPGMKLVAVNGRRYSPAVLRAAIAATGKSPGPVELLVESDEFYKTLALDYHGGERYPRLERDPARTDLLAEIFRPLAAAAPAKGAKPGN
jgi:predicted metalloprotease with PDZ domain